MKRLVIFALFACVLAAAGSIPKAEAADPPVFTSLRGGVYEDTDGDGRCEAGVLPVGDVGLIFSHGVIRIPLRTGANGTFGLVAMGPGLWEVRVVPPAGWRATSVSSQAHNVSATTTRVVTDINFCLQRTGAAAEDAPLVQLTGRILTPPAANDYSDEAATVRAEISQALLTNPEPAPLDEVQAMASTADPRPAPVGVPWLDYLNNFRLIGGLTPLPANDDLSLGAQLHSRYMVVNDKPVAHSQDKTNPLYSPNGQQAAENSDIFATTQLEATHAWAINFWISAPFHLVPILDPGLNAVGYGQHNQDTGRFKMSAVLDVLSDRQFPASGATYPLTFPAGGSETWVVRHSLYEWPDPLASCSGYSRPAGAPIVLQLGDGSGSPQINSYTVTVNGRPVVACAFTETTYTNSDIYAQQTGRLILDERDAVVIMPRQPIGVGQTVQVSLTVDGQPYEWSFNTVSAP